MARNVKFSFLRGGGSSLEVLYGKVSLTPTNLHTLSSTAVLPAPTTFDLVNGTALATNVAPTPAPVDGLLPWGYKVKITDNFGKTWEYLVGVPDGTTEINFNVLPRYSESRPPAFGVGPAGPAGQSATIAIGSTTSGPTPAVTNTGTSTEAVLNFTLAKGDKGDTGVGVPAGGTALQVVRKNAGNTTTEWATVDKTSLGLGNVDNTSDANKPLSTPQKTYVDFSNTLPYRNRGADALPSSYPEGVTVFLGSGSDGFPDVPGSVGGFSVVRTDKPRGYSSVVQYLSAYGNTSEPLDSAPILYRIGNNASDVWGAWQTILTRETADGLYGKATSGFVNVVEQGVVGDGVVNDAAAFYAAAARAVALGVPLLVPNGLNIGIGTYQKLPAGITVVIEGETLFSQLPTLTGRIPVLALSSGTNIYGTVNIRTLGGVANQGIAVSGLTNVYIQSLDVRSSLVAAGSGNIRDNGLNLTETSNVRIDKVYIENFDWPIWAYNSPNLTIGWIDILTYVKGMHLENVSNSRFGGGWIRGASPNGVYQPGHNGILMECDVANDNVKFRDFVIEDSKEHGFRISGPVKQTNIWVESCLVRNVGGTGFKLLGGTLEAGIYNENFVYSNCTVEDAGQINQNTCGFLIQLAKNVRVVNPVVRKRNKTYSAVEGIRMSGVYNVSVVSPRIHDTLTFGIRVDEVLGDVNDFTASDVHVRSDTGHGIYLQNSGVNFRNIQFDGYAEMRSPGGSAFYAGRYTGPDTGTWSGYCKIHLSAVGTAGTLINPNSSTNGIGAFYAEIVGPKTGSWVFKNGSMWLDNTVGLRYLAKAGAWTTL